MCLLFDPIIILLEFQSREIFAGVHKGMDNAYYVLFIKQKNWSQTKCLSIE